MRKTIICLLAMLLEAHGNETSPRSCRRFLRNSGWFNNVWTRYSEDRFKKLFRISKTTFVYILDAVRPGLVRQTLCEEPISPEERLGIALYRLSRGDYLQTISEMTGRGTSTVRVLTQDVCALIKSQFWGKHVKFPRTEEEMLKCMNLMEELWQSTRAFAAVDGCHIAVKCPPGGAEARREYYNFKNFYSIVMMGMLDAKYRFVWASVGLPGSVHDATILQSSAMYRKLKDGDILPEIFKEFEGEKIPPIILGDSAFPHHTWLQKPYSHAVLTEKESYFNYRLSRGQMVTECAYGQLKGRWRMLYRKSECTPDTMKDIVLACIVLHNICIDKDDSLPAVFNLCFDKDGVMLNQKRRREKLVMMNGHAVADNGKGAEKVREALKNKFWNEKILT